MLTCLLLFFEQILDELSTCLFLNNTNSIKQHDFCSIEQTAIGLLEQNSFSWEFFGEFERVRVVGVQISGAVSEEQGSIPVGLPLLQEGGLLVPPVVAPLHHPRRAHELLRVEGRCNEPRLRSEIVLKFCGFHNVFPSFFLDQKRTLKLKRNQVYIERATDTWWKIIPELVVISDDKNYF